MPRQEKESKLRQLINEMSEENEYKNLMQNRDRARSVTVGTCGGGVVELHMRGDYHSSWMSLTPTEAIELAEQLSAACGVKVAMRPKDDFSAWRGWDTSNIDKDNPWAQPKQLDGQSETPKLPFEPHNPENRERITEFMEQRDKDVDDRQPGPQGTYGGQYDDGVTHLAPQPAPLDPPKDREKIHEWFEDSVEKVTDEIVERVERDKEERFERDQAMRKLVKDSHKQRDKKNQEKLKQEVQ